MRNRGQVRTMIALAGVILVTSPARAYTVGKECIENYSSCPGNSNLPFACDETDFAGDFNGSVSFYWKNNDVFWGDMADVTEGGHDDQWADDVDVFLFSGHGSNGGSDNILGITTPASACDYVQSGGTPQEFYFDREAELVFLDASCTGVLGERYAVWYGYGGDGGMMIDLKQGFAFMNSPTDSGWRFWKFLNYTDNLSMTNEEAWLEAGNGCVDPGICDDESPIVFTKGDSASDVTSRVDNMSMDNFQSYSTPTGGWYIWSRVDNGSC